MNVEISHQKDCKKSNLVTDLYTGEVACITCGYVINEKILEYGPENYGLDKQEYESSTRVGGKITLKMADMGLSTVIQSTDRDSAGKSLSRENKQIFYRLRMWDRNSRSALTDKSFHRAFTMLDGIRAKIALPEPVVEKTAYLFRKISARKILSGRSTQGILCATIYIACRLTGTPRTIQDIADAGNVKKKVLQRMYRFLIKELEINPETYSPTEFVARLVNATGSSEKTHRDALVILDQAQRLGIATSKNPLSLAAAAMHLAALNNREKVSQLKISEASRISAVTIRDRARELKKMMEVKKNGKNM